MKITDALRSMLRGARVHHTAGALLDADEAADRQAILEAALSDEARDGPSTSIRDGFSPRNFLIERGDIVDAMIDRKCRGHWDYRIVVSDLDFAALLLLSAAGRKPLVKLRLEDAVFPFRYRGHILSVSSHVRPKSPEIFRIASDG